MKRRSFILIFMFLLCSCQVYNAVLTERSPNEAPIPSPKITTSLAFDTITPEIDRTLIVNNSSTGYPSILSPTLAITLTIKPSKVVTTPIPNSSIPSHSIIYAWKSQSPMSSKYGYFDLGNGTLSRWNDLTSVDNNSSGANRSGSLNFSHDSEKITYLIWSDHAELWISDIRLRYPDQVWIDDERWLPDINDSLMSRIVWGVNDRYVILVPQFTNNHILIVDLKDNTSEQWLGSCDMLVKSPASGNLVIGCEHSEDAPDSGYISLGEDGIIRTEEKPEVIARVIDWAYSPDGESLLFADEDLNIFTTSPDGNLLQLPATYESSEFFDISIRQNLQWSQDGRNVLVYAYGNPRSLCPQWMREELEDRPCWLVFDARTGKVVWNPTGEITGLSVPWESLTMVHGAALSPDGKWLAMISFDMSKPGRTIYLLVASIKENKITMMEGEEITHLHWAQEE